MQSFKVTSNRESQRRPENSDPLANAIQRPKVSQWWILPLLLVAATVIVEAQTVTFREITAEAGIHFTHNNGAFGKKWLPETMVFPTSCS
jgi:hypothetical protein